MPCWEEDQESAFSIDLENFPAELILEIFSHLEIDDLCRVGRVCSRWYSLTRYRLLWETVDCRSLTLSAVKMGKLFDILPSNTKHLRICSFPFDPDFPPFPVLQRRCPDLETLLLDNVVMMEAEGVNVHIENLPLKVTVLSLRQCLVIPQNFFPSSFLSQDRYPKIEILDCTQSRYFNDYNLSVFSKLRFLRELHLSGCHFGDYGLANLIEAVPMLRVLDLECTLVIGRELERLGQSCQFLEELFLGGTEVTDLELRAIQEGSFPNLRAICLIGTMISWSCRLSLALSLPTLQSIDGVPCSQIKEGNLKETFPKTAGETFPNFAFKVCNHFLTRLKRFKV